jgi:8-oxo-dGTP pyrophosphatase MutT (NUDIX family)
MAPEPRPGWSYCNPPADCRQSGVILLLYPGAKGQLCFLLTLRTHRVGTHKGQVSLPGGARHANEPLSQTALREISEELGIPTEGIEMLGSLSPLYVPVSNYCIHPFVGYQTEPPVTRPDPVEVEDVMEVPLHAVLDPRNRQVEYWADEGFAGRRRVPCFRLHGWLVWGATAMILSEMAALLGSAAGETT